jgi:GntR family transcriptional repressor for pyruvate dehydrogenase complex
MSHTDQVTQVATRLEQAILGGEFAAGERLPPERELAKQLGVSRSVLREALGRLTSLGLVRSRHGSGTRVQAPSPRQLAVGYQRLLAGPEFRLEHLAQVRLPLEVAIAALAATHRTDAHLARLEKTQKDLGNPRGSLEKHVAADVDFHQVLAEATGNPLFSVVLAPIQKLLIESRRRTLGRFGSELAHRHHARVLAAVAARDAAAAAAAMRQHLEANVEHLRAVDEAGGKVV